MTFYLIISTICLIILTSRFKMIFYHAKLFFYLVFSPQKLALVVFSGFSKLKLCAKQFFHTSHFCVVGYILFSVHKGFWNKNNSIDMSKPCAYSLIPVSEHLFVLINTILRLLVLWPSMRESDGHKLLDLLCSHLNSSSLSGQAI